MVRDDFRAAQFGCCGAGVVRRFIVIGLALTQMGSLTLARHVLRIFPFAAALFHSTLLLIRWKWRL
jgi:hypothetical protein